MNLFGCTIESLPHTPAIFHPPVACTGHQDHLTWLAIGAECFPVAIFSDQPWMKNSYFIISSEHPISWTCFVATSMDCRIHRPYFIPPVACTGHQDHLTWFAIGTEGFPVAIFSNSELKNSYFIMSSAQPISAGFLVSKSMNLRMHLPNFIRPYLALVIRMTLSWFALCHWRSPSCNTLWADLNAKSYFIISSVQPMSVVFFVCASSVFRMHLPNFMRPYLALVIITTSPGLQCALKVSQLQYSLI